MPALTSWRTLAVEHLSRKRHHIAALSAAVAVPRGPTLHDAARRSAVAVVFVVNGAGEARDTAHAPDVEAQGLGHVGDVGAVAGLVWP